MSLMKEGVVDYDDYRKNVPLMAIINRELSGKKRTRPISEEDRKALIVVAAKRAKKTR